MKNLQMLFVQRTGPRGSTEPGRCVAGGACGVDSTPRPFRAGSSGGRTLSGAGEVCRAVDALPELEQKTQLAEESALRKLQEIRPHATRLEEAEHYRLPLMASAAVERLAEEYGHIRLDRETAGAAVQSRLADLEKAKRSLEKLGPMLDTGSLQRLVNRIRATAPWRNSTTTSSWRSPSWRTPFLAS